MIPHWKLAFERIATRLIRDPTNPTVWRTADGRFTVVSYKPPSKGQVRKKDFWSEPTMQELQQARQRSPKMKFWVYDQTKTIVAEMDSLAEAQKKVNELEKL